jgi:endonuclease YncB( thermonuclease family)
MPGDAIWVGGEKIRLQSIDAPEIDGKCLYEKDLAQRAKYRLNEILSGVECPGFHGHDNSARNASWRSRKCLVYRGYGVFVAYTSSSKLIGVNMT